ncbi:heterokaryon incompatibility protein-domain-containing protein [Chaetomium sp. MPI-CAGE-AT-0009]|nr:heterokaryon incompatibility protein-domain-containing protein [Chaetomium sp. MPI-CAGE-AT-0009]
MSPAFEYLPLKEEQLEIRLLSVQPGCECDPLVLHIRHASLLIPLTSPHPRLSVGELQKTLPKGWAVFETDGPGRRFLFEHEETDTTSWTHPDPSFDPGLYAPLDELPPAQFEPDYEALSYVWGSMDDARETALIRYANLTTVAAGFSSITLGNNLANALRHLRYRDRPRALWIDAVCVNQQALDERGSQLRRMADIYRLARRVVIWLGPASMDSTLAMSTLSHLGAQVEVSINQVRFRSPSASEPEWYHSSHPLPYGPETWAALLSFVERSWFERLWVWQEAALSNSQAVAVCGHDQTHWHQIRVACICLFAKRTLPHPGLRERLHTLQTITTATSAQGVYILLYHARKRLCSEPSDKVYGILGIASHGFVSRIVPRYSQPFSQVYRDAFMAYLDLTHRLDLLTGCNLADRSMLMQETPSWVPDWSTTLSTWPLQAFQFATGISCSHRQHNAHAVSGNLLTVTGIQAAIIHQVAVPAPSNFKERALHLASWEPKDAANRLYSPPLANRTTQETLFDAFLKTIRANFLRERWPTVAEHSLEDWKQAYQTIASGTEPLEATLNDASVYWCLKLIGGRTLATTVEGYIGLVPSAALPGDIIVVLLGCKSPMLLRPLPDDTDSYLIVGECYVHGLEDSQAILGPLPHEYRAQLAKSKDGQGTALLFRNMVTGEVSEQDPRLEPLGGPDCPWERVQMDREPDDPPSIQCFRNTLDGRIMKSDPRILPDALRRRGAKFVDFKLQ